MCMSGAAVGKRGSWKTEIGIGRQFLGLVGG